MPASIFLIASLNLVQSNGKVLPIIILSAPLSGENAAMEFFVNMRRLCLYRGQLSYGLVMGMWRPPHSYTYTGTDSWEIEV